MGGGVVRGGKPHLRSISPAIEPTETRGKEGVRREEGLCIFLYLWQTAVLAWFKLPIEIFTSQPVWNPQDATGATCPSEQPANQSLLWLGCPSPTISQYLGILLRVGQGPFISIKMWSPRSHSSCGPSPWQIPHLWLYFQTLTAQHPLTGCETTTKKQLRGNAGKGVV